MESTYFANDSSEEGWIGIHHGLMASFRQRKRPVRVLAQKSIDVPSPQTTGHFFLNKRTAFYGEVGGAVPTTACAVGQTELVPYKAVQRAFSVCSSCITRMACLEG